MVQARVGERRCMQETVQVRGSGQEMVWARMGEGQAIVEQSSCNRTKGSDLLYAHQLYSHTGYVTRQAEDSCIYTCYVLHRAGPL